MSNHLGNVMVVVSDRKVYDGSVFKADLVSTTDYYAFGMVMSDRSYNTEGYRFGFNGQEKSDEISGSGNHNTTEYREYDVRLSRWWSRDPKSASSPWSSPYVVNGNNPIMMIDPKGDKEYKSLKDYTKTTGNKELGKGDWLKSDRKNNTDVWKKANEYNLNQKAGQDEYTNIEQRAAFYGWFQDAVTTKGFGIKWAGAASEVASAINNIANPEFIGINVTLIADGFSYSSNEAREFSNLGNRMIFEDVFPKLRTLYNGPVLKGQEAFNWDAKALSQEQNLIQSLYERTNAFGIISGGSKQIFFGSSTLAFIKGVDIAPFPKNGNLMSVNERWSYGMAAMKYNVQPNQMPPPGAAYTNGEMYSKFRKAGATGSY